MKLAIFGGSGRTGQHLLQQALDAGHEVNALVRTPAKLSISGDSRLRIISGDVLEADKVDQTIQGVEVIISVMGPVVEGMQNILNSMNKYGVRRLIISAGAGVPDANDQPGLLHHLISFLLKTTARKVYDETLGVVEMVRKSEVDWTIVRVPMLTDSPQTGNIRVGYLGKGTGPRLSRADMAAYMLGQTQDKRYLRLAPVVSN